MVHVCGLCGSSFDSRNKLHQHLQESGHSTAGHTRDASTETGVHNDAFDEYYRRQRICGSDEAWAAALERFKKPLPMCVRVSLSSPSGGFCAALLARFAPATPTILQSRTFQAFTLDLTNADPLAAPLLAAAQECGSLQRQELVSCLPPILLEAEPKHVIVDLCAAPGSKALQILDIMHCERRPDAMPGEGDGTAHLRSATEEADSLPNERWPDVMAGGLLIANEVDRARLVAMCQRARRLPRAPMLALCTDARYYPGLRRRATRHTVVQGYRSNHMPNEHA